MRMLQLNMCTLEPPNAVPYCNFPESTPACMRVSAYTQANISFTLPARSSIILPTVIRDGNP
jgi:hypothetical protein